MRSDDSYPEGASLQVYWLVLLCVPSINDVKREASDISRRGNCEGKEWFHSIWSGAQFGDNQFLRSRMAILRI